MKGTVLIGILLVGSGCSDASRESSGLRSTSQHDLRRIRHVIVIMQENRSFDHYFGTYPGADGIPMQDGVPAVCVPNPRVNRCIRPFHAGAEGAQPDCDDDAMTCPEKPQTVGTPSIWNPLPFFTTVQRDGQLGNVQITSRRQSSTPTGMGFGRPAS